MEKGRIPNPIVIFLCDKQVGQKVRVNAAFHCVNAKTNFRNQKERITQDPFCLFYVGQSKLRGLGWNKGTLKWMAIPSNVISNSVTVILGAELPAECCLAASVLGLEVGRNSNI